MVVINKFADLVQQTSCALGIVIFVGLINSSCQTSKLVGEVSGVELKDLTESRVNIVSLGEGGESMILKLSADSDFEWVPENPEGKYLIEVITPGYEVASKTVDLRKDGLKITLKANKTAGVDLKTIDYSRNLNVDKDDGEVSIGVPKL